MVSKAANQAVGFTLIELVAIIMVIAVLSITVLPKFSGRSGLAEYALRDQLITLARHAQQRAMFDHSGACYRLLIQASDAQVQRDGLLLDAQSSIAFSGDYNGLSATPAALYFDALGNLLTGGSDCASSTHPASVLSIAISGGNPVSLLIHPTGYVQRQG